MDTFCGIGLRDVQWARGEVGERFPKPCVVPSELFPVTRLLTAGFKGLFYVNCWGCGGIVPVQLENVCDRPPSSGFHPIDSSFEEEYIGASGPSFLELRDRTARSCQPGPPDNSQEGGGGRWKSELHRARLARRVEGGLLLGHADRFSTGCAAWHHRPTGLQPNRNVGELTPARGTQAPGSN